MIQFHLESQVNVIQLIRIKGWDYDPTKNIDISDILWKPAIDYEPPQKNEKPKTHKYYTLYYLHIT